MKRVDLHGSYRMSLVEAPEGAPAKKVARLRGELCLVLDDMISHWVASGKPAGEFMIGVAERREDGE